MLPGANHLYANPLCANQPSGTCRAKWLPRPRCGAALFRFQSQVIPTIRQFLTRWLDRDVQSILEPRSAGHRQSQPLVWWQCFVPLDGAKPRHHTMHGLKPFDTLGRYPILLAGRLGYHSSIFESQAIKESLPAGSELRLVFLRTENWELGTFFLRHQYQRMQHIVQLIGVAHI